MPIEIDQPIHGVRASELILIFRDLLRRTAEIDGLANEGALNARIRHRGADLGGIAVRKSRHALGIAEPKTLDDLRIDPELRALPQFCADEIHGVPALAALVRIEAVRAEIGRAERRRVLLDEGGLALERKPIEIERRKSLGENIGIDAGVAELIIEADTKRLHREAGRELLGAAGKGHAARAIAGIEIFEPRRPTRRQPERDADAGSATEARHQEQIFRCAGRRRAADRHARDLRASELISRPGEAAGGIEQPVAGSVADPAAQGAGHFHLFGVARRAGRRR